MFIGYDHSLKPLPLRPWGGEDVEEETAYQARIRRKVNLAELNAKKKNFEKD